MLLWVLGLTHRVRAARSPRRRLIDRLVAARKAAGLTQVVLAGKLAKPQHFVSRYEVGDRRLDIVEYVYVARALDVDPVAEVALCAPTKSV